MQSLSRYATTMAPTWTSRLNSSQICHKLIKTVSSSDPECSFSHGTGYMLLLDMPFVIADKHRCTYIGLVWGLKATMLFFFNRLTFGLRQQMLVKWLAIFVSVTYLAVFLTITFACFPTQRNWQVVPDPPSSLRVFTFVRSLTS